MGFVTSVIDDSKASTVSLEYKRKTWQIGSRQDEKPLLYAWSSEEDEEVNYRPGENIFITK